MAYNATTMCQLIKPDTKYLVSIGRTNALNIEGTMTCAVQPKMRKAESIYVSYNDLGSATEDEKAENIFADSRQEMQLRYN